MATTTGKTSKVFIQMSGAPGSGKSTIANLLAKSINGVVIDHDIIRSSILEVLQPRLSFDEAAEAAYAMQWNLADSILSQDHSVIVDSTCNYQEVLDRGTALAKQYGCSYWYVECKVEDIDLLDERLRGRVPLRSQRIGVDRPPAHAAATRPSEEDSRALFKRWIENPCRPSGNAIIVDSTGNPEETRDYILGLILPLTSPGVQEKQ